MMQRLMNYYPPWQPALHDHVEVGDQRSDFFERLIVKVEASERQIKLLSAAMEALVADPSFRGQELEETLDPLKAREIFELMGWMPCFRVRRQRH